MHVAAYITPLVLQLPPPSRRFIVWLPCFITDVSSILGHSLHLLHGFVFSVVLFVGVRISFLVSFDRIVAVLRKDTIGTDLNI